MSSIPHYINIKGDDTLVRDTFSMGILNMNSHALAEAQRRHQEALSKLAADRRKETELNTLRTDVAELRVLVNMLLEREK